MLLPISASTVITFFFCFLKRPSSIQGLHSIRRMMAQLLALAQMQAKCEAAISQQTGSPLRNGAARTGRGLLSLQRPRERNERTSFEDFTKQLRCNWNLTLHKGG